MPVLTSCCRCMSLRTGTLLTAGASIIGGIIYLILAAVNAVRVKTIVFEELSQNMVLVIIALNLGITIAIAVLLIFGTLKRNLWLMFPWLFLSMVQIVGSVISLMYSAVESYIRDEVWTGTVFLIMVPATFASSLYLWLVVYSHFQEIMEDK